MAFLSKLFAKEKQPDIKRLKAARDIDALFEAATDSDWSIRYEAIQALAEIGDARAVPNLIARLDDEHKEVRNAAARALNRIGGAQAFQALAERGLLIRPAFARPLPPPDNE
jgi:HEAT repeat protein